MPVDSVPLDAVHQDGQVRERTPLENEVIASFPQGPRDRGDVEEDWPLAVSMSSGGNERTDEPAPPVIRVVMVSPCKCR